MADGSSKRFRSSQDQLAAAIAAGNIMTSAPGEGELMGLSTATVEALEQHAASLRAFEARQRQHTIVVPTKDEDVALALRSLGHPICLFGEKLIDRIQRLKRILAEAQVDAELLGKEVPSLPSILAETGMAVEPKVKEEKQTRSYFTEASEALIAARYAIAEYSFTRAKARLMQEYNAPVPLNQSRASMRDNIKLEMKAILNEIRPISACSFSSDGEFICTSSFDQNCRIYRASGDFALLHTLKGHEHRVCDIAFMPGAVDSLPIVASASAEGEVRVWSGESTRSILKGHVQRIGRLAWHPLGRWFVSASYDRTWRLWDVETGSSLLTQDGFSKEIYATAFHPDGALIAACDLGAAVTVWDLRAGKVTHQLAGHVMGVLSADFSSNGQHLATSGLDNQVRVWDLRKKECFQVLPAHLKPVTRCRYSQDGKTLVSVSHDHSIKVWDVLSWKRLASLVAHDGPILGMDVTGDLRIATSGYDKALNIVEART